MSDNVPITLFDRPSYSGVLPLSWETLDAPPGAIQQALLDEANEAVLRACYMLDERRIDVPEEDDEHGQELVRIEQRLNLLVDLVGQLLRANRVVPDAVLCVFNTLGMEWRDRRVPAVGQILEFRIHLHPSYPRPLQLWGRVESVDAPEAEGGVRITVRFGDLHMAVGEWMEKLIFRRHRRRVAQARQKK